MNVECVILEKSGDRIAINLNKLIRSSCGKLGWDLIDETPHSYSTIRAAYIAAIDWKPHLPIISKVAEKYFQDRYRHLFECAPNELERAYVRLARRNYKTQHRLNVRGADLQAHEN